MQYTKELLDRIIESHQHYLNNDCPNWVSMRANLHGADIRGANLRGANLSYADLHGADLSGVELRYAKLSDVKLRYANLRGANLNGAYLIGADLNGANLRYADLSCANLRGADLSGADLLGADLSGADLIRADLRCADLSGANLSDADLSEAERPRLGKILDEPLTGYKKSREGNIITATIPVGAVVFSINNSKCRTNKARIIDMEGAELLHSQHNSSFEYRLFQDIEIKDFNLMYNIECASGFHFFKTRDEAKKY